MTFTALKAENLMRPLYALSHALPPPARTRRQPSGVCQLMHAEARRVCLLELTLATCPASRHYLHPAQAHNTIGPANRARLIDKSKRDGIGRGPLDEERRAHAVACELRDNSR
eukprot:CAMPEP_0185200994 /NCGR_PEP_ID=MMETSP1140-20130426/48426_1 /TAXON_ID=298111 /ORGANISM="Pavlova sp., Strain CCMP459" /LENGTH=112 /DNA_ID=CAMNT_0027768369 /DNA_START=86 /DNA_END=421 /DNA_ORIENTATION=-